MTALGRRTTVAVLFWVLLAVIVWNGLYDLLLARSTQHYLFEQAIHQAGRGPWIDLSNAMDVAVRDAVWLSTLWASVILLAGLLTVRFRTGVRPRSDPTVVSVRYRTGVRPGSDPTP